ncbi:GntR family transcriptional regulator [Streptomyces massasporeus]|uniref:GntR family transcriptional regulator n=1 Tax=Streptomyces massasporeus TaxID=67324 RepID=UPI003700ABF3
MAEERHEDASGRALERVLSALRAGMADLTYAPGALLPPQRELAAQLGVSRDTVQRALRQLRDEGLIDSRQGSGSRVLTRAVHRANPAGETGARPQTLASFIGRAFERNDIVLDVYTLTSETLDAHIRLQAERIRARETAPDRIALRMMLPDEEMELPYPRNRADPSDGRVQARLHRITRQYLGNLKRTLRDLLADGFVRSVDVQVRRVRLTPTFKLYLAHGEEALYGPYAVIERRILLDDTGEEIDALDVLGIGATLTHHVTGGDPSSPGALFVSSQQQWFDSVWEHLATDD